MPAPASSLRAATSRAASVGSPVISHVSFSPLKWIVAFEQRAQTLSASTRSAWRFGSAILMLPMRKSPLGSNPVPVMVNVAIGVVSISALMRPSVRVPVLSEQITVTEPRVSSAGIVLTMTSCWAQRRTPRASETVTTATRPSGMTATARVMPTLNQRCRSEPLMVPDLTRTRMSPIATTMAQRMSESPTSIFPRRPSFCMSGETLAECPVRADEMAPICVESPVRTTMPSPMPFVTTLAMNAMFLRSPTESTPTAS
eukprot:Amastigsp_a683_8.p4 type:complete len:257 gc:universal Amastigsp_a683_8:1682-912(-)